MAKFQKKIDIDPQDIPGLDNSHKQDCVDVISRAINSTFKYTMLVCVIIGAAYGAYSIFGLIYMLRMNSMLTAISPIFPLLVLITAIFEFISGTMKRWALVLEIILHAALIIVSVMQIQTAIAAPFVFYGTILHIKLMMLLPYHEIISQQKGYPYFTELPIGDVIKKAEPPEEKASENEKAAEDKTEENSPDDSSEKENSTNIT